jgi:hypothetical protein
MIPMHEISGRSERFKGGFGKFPFVLHMSETAL